MEILMYLSSLVVTYPILVTFIAGFLAEEFLVFMAILSGKGELSFWLVYIVGFIAILCADSLYFIIGKSTLGELVKRIFSKPQKRLDKKLTFVNKEKHIIYLFATKFFHGTRIASILYYSVTGMTYRKFISYDALAVFIWSIIMLPVGYFAGRGFESILKVTKGAEKIFIIIVIAVVIILVINFVARKVLIKEQKYLK